MTRYKLLTFTQPAEHVAQAGLARPESANALNTAMALELIDFFAHLPRETRVAILTGSGRHFCAGADLKERHGMGEAEWKEQHAHFRAARDAIYNCRIPVIAAVNGAAFGGGLELALACDFIYAADNAKFALSEASLGIMPGMGGTHTLPDAVGTRRARELLYTARAFSAAEAFSMGMVNRLCPGEKLLAEAISCAKLIAGNAPKPVAFMKTLTRGAMEWDKELHYYNQLLTTKDRQEGIAAFNEKRPPHFIGE